MEDGIVLLDMDVENMSDLLNLFFDEAELKHLISQSQRIIIEGLFSHNVLSVSPPVLNVTRESCKVYCASVNGFFTPLVCLIRLGNSVQINNDGLPIRYFLFVLGDESIAEEYFITLVTQ